MQPHLYYTPSGRTTSGNIVSAYLIMLAIAYFLAIAYTVMVMVIPIVYLKGFITGGAALLITFCARSIGKIFKLRYKKEYLNLVMVSVIFLYYFSWVVFVALVSDGFPGAGNVALHFDILFSPLLFFEYIGNLYSEGMYVFFGGKLNGWAIGLVWLMEFLLLFIIPYALTYRRNLPLFSSNLNKWYPKYNLKQFFENISAANKFKTELEKNYMEAISNMGKGMANRYGQISIYYLKNDPDAYLSLTNVFIEAQGTGKRVETPVLHGFRISAKDAEILMEKYKVDKEFFLDH